jgi:hypothetical protein
LLAASSLLFTVASAFPSHQHRRSIFQTRSSASLTRFRASGFSSRRGGGGGGGGGICGGGGSDEKEAADEVADPEHLIVRSSKKKNAPQQHRDGRDAVSISHPLSASLEGCKH